jgi:hypothetical protein
MLALERPDTLTDPNPGPHLRIMPMSEVLDMKSGDYYKRLGDVITRKHDYMYRALVRIIRDKGFQPGFGVVIEDEYGEPTLVNGHHRVAALQELGAQWVPVSQDDDDGWPYDTDEYLKVKAEERTKTGNDSDYS